MGCLIDSCIWIDVERGLISPSDVALYTGIDPVYISSVTLAELGYGVEMAVSEEIKQNNFSFLTKNKKDFEDIPGLKLIIFGD